MWKPDYVPPAKGRGSKLTDKQTAFVNEYMVDLNASKAVQRAGYKTKNPRQIAAELLAHPLVKAEIDKRKEKRMAKNEVDAQYVLSKLIAITEETETNNPQAALRALELLGKHLGMYRDRQEISGPDGEAIKMEQKVKEDVSDFTSKLSRLATAAGTGSVVKLVS